MQPLCAERALPCAAEKASQGAGMAAKRRRVHRGGFSLSPRRLGQVPVCAGVFIANEKYVVSVPNHRIRSCDGTALASAADPASSRPLGRSAQQSAGSSRLRTRRTPLRSNANLAWSQAKAPQ